MQRTVFFISDGTAITTETMGHSLLIQFSELETSQVRLPFMDSEDKAREAVNQINAAFQRDGAEPLVFTTIMDKNLSDILAQSRGHTLDLLGGFLGKLGSILGMQPEYKVGQAHGLGDIDSYDIRMDATNYALTHDDGLSLNFDGADVILVGVSRSGKTPTCLYMGLHYGVKAGNYPLTLEDLDSMRLPGFLRQHKRKLFGLTIDPDRLCQIREIRKPGSRYASLRQCRHEVDAAESMLRMEGVPMLRTTHISIEEMASRIMQHMGLQKELH